MADDPHRDLLPVKEGSCVNTCRSSVIVARERHIVCKLDRYELEDRYLRLLDEVQDLKKLSNIQEDKIKRLATKLMRVAATPRSCLQTALDFSNDRNRVDCLEHENAKLKDKITVLRNQILNHKFGRSRSRRLETYPSSGPTTFRSEIGRVKSETSHLIHDIEDGKSEQDYLAKIEELEVQKKEMTSRIEELESQLENHRAGKQREKTAENVEFIRVWRQMKQQSEQLASAQAVNVASTARIHDLKEMLEEKTRNIKEVTSALMAEKKKLSELDGLLAMAKNSQLSLREKDEQIKDLMSEMRILQQHNAELIALTSKYSKVEQENADLRKKISEHLSDHQSLKSAFSNEQANMTALQAANEKLMAKLHDLQRNIDSLTIQLKSFQFQNERRDKLEPEIRIVRTMDRGTSTNSLPEKLVAPLEEKIPKSEAKNMVDREMQTECDKPADFIDVQREEVDEQSPKQPIVPQSPMRADRSFQPNNGTATLLPEEMLKLLEQAQINVPLDVHNAAKMRQIASTLPKEYLNSTEPHQRQRIIRVDGNLGGYYKSQRSSSAITNSISGSSSEKDSIVSRKAHKEDSHVMKKQSDSAELNESITSGSRTIENGSTILTMKRSGPRKELFHPPQVNSRNSSRDKALEQLKSADVIRSSQVPGESSVNGTSKNNESRRESGVDSYISTSLEQSDSSVIRAMEDEDATSDDIRDAGKQRQISSAETIIRKVEAGSMEDDTEKVDSESVTEFNSLIRNNTILSPRESTSSVQDLGTVFSDDNWHEYKRRSMASQARFSKPSTYSDRSRASDLADRPSRNNSTVIIRIESLSLDHKCPLLVDPEIHQIYIEFSFLGYHGADLETISVSKPTANTTTYFNYMRRIYNYDNDLYIAEFEIDEERHQPQRSTLRAMMTDNDNPTVKFTLVSEPLPEEMETKECMEVGYAYFNIRDHVLSGGSNEVTLTVMDERQTEAMGILKITVLGVEAIRRCMSDLA